VISLVPLPAQLADQVRSSRDCTSPVGSVLSAWPQSAVLRLSEPPAGQQAIAASEPEQGALLKLPRRAPGDRQVEVLVRFKRLAQGDGVHQGKGRTEGVPLARVEELVLSNRVFRFR
jgi:hypothetical protein